VLASLLAVGVVVLVLWAAATGPGTVLEGEGRDRVPLSEPTPTSQSAEAGTGVPPVRVTAVSRAAVAAGMVRMEGLLVDGVARSTPGPAPRLHGDATWGPGPVLTARG